ncbi:hypothetical protein DL96DRAFT_1621594 [Flagelloscypha sp. PMI_526]|nr:hypothetical protein DL96DRAFT_1621594 [Flagelloscypha sp. PMI_526]
MQRAHLPLDLEHCIFTLAVHSDRKTLRPLLLVARRTYEWLHSFRFTFLSLTPSSSPEKIDYFCNLSPEILQTSIKSLLLVGQKSDHSDPKRHSILQHTIGVKDLTIDNRFLHPTDIQRYASCSHLRMLTLGADANRSLANFLQYSPDIVFPTLTHLDCSSPGMPPNVTMSYHFPALTHFMIAYFGVHRRVVMNLLADPRNLVLLVLKFRKDEEFKWYQGSISATMGSEDTAERICVSIVAPDLDLENIWRKRVFENVNRWEVAKSMLKARHYHLQRT